MKKLFTLVALLACFLGANAQDWEKVYEIDYTGYNGFPFYVMGYVPEFLGDGMTDYGANFSYKTDAEMEEGDFNEVGTVTTAGGVLYHKVELTSPGWHQYFIADNIPSIIDGKYKVVALVKANEAASINVNMGWGWGSGEQVGTSVAIPQADDFAEVEWEYSGIGGTSCNLVAQPGGFTGTIVWKSLVVYQKKEEGGRPQEWAQTIVNGDAETPWPDWALEENSDGININWRTDRAPEICSWSLTMGKNNDEGPSDLVTDNRARPYPSDIEVDPNNANNHVFAVHVTQIDKIDDDGSIAWSNQYWIQSNREYKAASQVRIKFRYKADHACSVGTQWHKKNPSNYLDWQALGDISFTEDWQEFSKTASINTAGAWSLCFNLCSDADNGRTPNVFYFDDLSWEYLVLDEGFFVAGINTNTTNEYTNLLLDNAVEFVLEDPEDDECFTYVANIGTKGDKTTYVDQVMISTVRGDGQSYKGATLKPVSKAINNPDEWTDYEASSNAKIDLPGLGVWTIWIDTEYNAMAFEMLEGTPYEEAEPVAVFTYTDEITVNGKEREDLKDSWDANKQELTVREEADNNTAEDSHGAGGEGHNGETWDNQFFIKANHKLEKGTVTKLVFKYKASVAEAKTTTQCHGENPGAYMHWAAIGDVVFTDEWQDFEKEFTVPDAADGMWNIAFNMAEIKEACDYSIKDVQWYLYDASLDAGLTPENLISGSTNFYKKEGAGTDPYTGIENVTVKNVKTSNAIYNIAGQRVNKDYKGLVIKDGKKFVK